MAEYGYHAERQIRALEGREEIAEPQNYRWEFKRIVEIWGKAEPRCEILRKTVLNPSVLRNSEVLVRFWNSSLAQEIMELVKWAI